MCLLNKMIYNALNIFLIINRYIRTGNIFIKKQLGYAVLDQLTHRTNKPILTCKCKAMLS